MFKVGDRIRLEDMPQDPNPIPRGTTGTVTDCERIDGGPGQRFWQVSVDWDNGRTLMMCVPPDRATIIG